jgi:SPP1 family predicted phage head-tail adaptor
MLDLRVTLYQPTRVTNNSGQVVKTWTNAGTFYAERVVQPNTGADIMPYDQIVSATIITWRLRYPNSVKATWYLAQGGEDYDIISVAPEGRQRYIIIKTRLRDNGTG